MLSLDVLRDAATAGCGTGGRVVGIDGVHEGLKEQSAALRVFRLHLQRKERQPVKRVKETANSKHLRLGHLYQNLIMQLMQTSADA
jgi:hypothetical protein